MIKNRVDIISMGCSKNLVDSERVMALFRQAGLNVEFNSHDVRGQIVVINTCGFIESAKQENIDMILRAIDAKKRHRIGRIYVMGCLSERYREELRAELPEVDGFYGKFDWTGLIDDLGLSHPHTAPERCLSTPGHYAYLKIAEGCSRSCAYCAIPLITGPYHSRPIDDIIAEAQELARRGVKELVVIAQDTTFYGVDMPEHKQLIAELTDRLCQIEGIEWIRLHYAYPNHFPDTLIDVIKLNPKVVRYLDLPLQHIADPVLKRMRRNSTKSEITRLISRLRSEIPGIAIRTTLMVGFPGETEADFNELLTFVRDTRFERLGVFEYSEEEDTYSAQHYPDDVPPEVKHRRRQAIMEAQACITSEISQSLIGKQLRVLVDSEEEDYYTARTEWDSPEEDLDLEVHILKTCNIPTGSFVDVEITDAEETADLEARVINR